MISSMSRLQRMVNMQSWCSEREHADLTLSVPMTLVAPGAAWMLAWLAAPSRDGGITLGSCQHQTLSFTTFASKSSQQSSSALNVQERLPYNSVVEIEPPRDEDVLGLDFPAVTVAKGLKFSVPSRRNVISDGWI